MKFQLGGSVTHRTSDALGDIVVMDYRKHRVLTFDTIFEQSKIDRNKPYLPVHEYNRAMLLPIAFAEPCHATVLGLGGGTMVNALHHLLPTCEIHAVELRQAVVDVAHAYFGLPHHPNIAVTVADARPVLHDMPEASTDLIMADLYSADRMSPAQGHRRFIDLCALALSDHGWLALNFHLAPSREGTMMQHIHRLFADVMLYRTKTNNYVLYASKRALHGDMPGATRLATLEQRLPIGWPQLIGKVWAA